MVASLLLSKKKITNPKILVTSDFETKISVDFRKRKRKTFSQDAVKTVYFTSVYYEFSVTLIDFARQFVINTDYFQTVFNGVLVDSFSKRRDINNIHNRHRKDFSFLYTKSIFRSSVKALQILGSYLAFIFIYFVYETNEFMVRRLTNTMLNCN